MRFAVCVTSGGVLIGATLLDIIWTVLGTHGGGPLTKHLARALWHCAVGLHWRKKNHRLLSFAGSAILSLIVLFWVVMVWLGWVVVFTATPASIVETSSSAAVDVLGRIYFIGYSMFTIGNGDLRPNGPWWRIAMSLVGFTGLGSVTLAITFLLEVLAAVVHKRALGVYISDLGGTPKKILERAWNGEKFEALEQHFVQITGMIHLYVEQHLAYPVLHYYHSEEKRPAATLRLAGLHETVVLLAEGTDPSVRLPRMITDPLRDAVGGLAQVVGGETVQPERRAPEDPSLDVLRELNIPAIDDETFRAAIGEERKIRRFLIALLHDDGWEWGESVGSGQTE